MPKQINFLENMNRASNEEGLRRLEDHQLAIEKERLAMQKNYHEAKFAKDDDDDLQKRISALSLQSGVAFSPADILAAVNRHIESRQEKNPVYISYQTPQSLAISELNSINNNLDIQEKRELYEIINEILIRNKFVPRESPNAKMPALEKEKEY
jgi:hypothetical protein